MSKLQLRQVFSSRYIAFALIGFGVAAAVSAAVLLARQRSVEPSPPSGDLVSRSALSSEKLKPAAVASYTVPNTHPKYIAIPAIGITNTPVLALGLQSDRAIATPQNINQAGWYNASSLPGQPGAMFIYGHVSSWTANGLFYNLKKLKVGQTITITRGDNKTYIYQVTGSKVYAHDKVNMAEVLLPSNAAKPGLNLMTCTGKIIKGTSEFDQRMVVFSSLVSKN